MPLFDYKCKKCSHTFEHLQELKDKDLVKCPECGKMGLVKQLGTFSPKFIGSGFYETDYKKK